METESPTDLRLEEVDVRDSPPAASLVIHISSSWNYEGHCGTTSHTFGFCSVYPQTVVIQPQLRNSKETKPKCLWSIWDALITSLKRTFNFPDIKKVDDISLNTVKNTVRKKGGILQIRPSWWGLLPECLHCAHICFRIKMDKTLRSINLKMSWLFCPHEKSTNGPKLWWTILLMYFYRMFHDQK